MLGLKKFIETQPATDKITGTWWQVSIKPDIKTDEVLNIGVALDVGGKFHYKLLNELDRLLCVYGQEIEPKANILLQAAEMQLKENTPKNSHHLFFSKRFLATGESPKEILSSLFYSTVPLGKPTKKRLVEEKETNLRLMGLIKEMRTYTQRKYGIEAESVYPSLMDYTTEFNDRIIKVSAPVRSEFAVGTIILANQKTPASVENNLNKGASNIHIVRNTDTQERKCGAIVLMPDDENTSDSVDNKFTKFMLEMKTSGIDIISHVDTEMLAEETYQWAMN